MTLDTWIAWLILAAVLIVAEMFTAGFFLFWFGVAAGVAMIASLAGASLTLQFGIFVVVAFLLLILTRPLAEKFSGKQPPGIGADRFLGKNGIVIETINPDKGTGMVRIKTEDWRADSLSGEVIEVDSRVVVKKVDGTRLVVAKSQQETE